jgi:uncharacterized protein YecE (DUF72 family)
MLRIGTSGWMYDAWKNGFYAGISKRLWLSHISRRLNAVEIDATFYRQQKPETFEKWATQVPEDFRFAVRGHRYVSHNKKLLDVSSALHKVKEQSEGLGHKLGPILWQVPPFMRINVKRVRSFGEELRDAWPGARHVLEFRHESWFVPEIADTLSEFGVANCISDSGTWPRWDAVTADLVYVRLHGRPYTYSSQYDDRALASWAELARQWLSEGREVHFYFDNDSQGHAPFDAMRLTEMLQTQAAQPFGRAA